MRPGTWCNRMRQVSTELTLPWRIRERCSNGEFTTAFRFSTTFPTGLPSRSTRSARGLSTALCFLLAVFNVPHLHPLRLLP